MDTTYLYMLNKYETSTYWTKNQLGRILWHDIVQFRCPGSGTTLKQDK